MSGAPNDEQTRYWNQEAGPKWVELQEVLDHQIRPLGEAALDAAAPQPGERGLDVGCGCGDTSLALARRLGDAGRALGVDLSGPMLARARERAVEAGLGNLEFLQADAQTHAFEPASFDLAVSRFGVMFFADPAAAFANLARALRPGGRLAFVCWQPLARNPWMAVPALAAAGELPEPPPPPDPHAPGPFAFGDPERVRGLLAAGGLDDVGVEALEGSLVVGHGLGFDAVVDFALRMGPTGRWLADASDALRERVRAAVDRALRPYAGDTGVRMAYAAWRVTARRPA